MKRPSTLTYLTIGLVTMTIALLSTAQMLGLIPDELTERARHRAEVCEVLTIALASAAQSGQFSEVDALTQAMRERDFGLLSAGLLQHNEGYAFATEGHADRWTDPEPENRLTHVRIPVQRQNEDWGTAEFRFTPLLPNTGFWWWHTRLFQLIAFMTLSGFLLYRLYLRRMLTFLDPSRAVPQRVRTAFDTLAEGVVILDEKQRVVLANQAFCAAVAMSEEQLEGRRLELPWQSLDDQTEMPWLQAAADGMEHRGYPLRIQRDGEAMSFMVSATAIQGDDGAVRGVLVTFDNVTSVEQKNEELADMISRLEASRDQIRRQNDELQLLATRDPLTGCLNRRAFRERFEAECKRAARSGASLCCVMADIDHFKNVNDTHGHAVGDQVLKSFAEVLRTTTRGSDIVARFGGEEFCILLPQTSLEQAARATENLRLSIAEARPAGLTITASFGVSVLEDNSGRIDDLIEQADQALYAAKRGGRNRVVRIDEIAGVETEVDQAPSPVPVAPEIPVTALTALVAALEQRDPGTAAHSRRVADLCIALGSDMLAADDCFILEVAALLHDVGKIGVADAVLLKPGPLTREERAVMDRHERFGIEIINSAFGCPELTRIVHCHHASFGGDARNPGLPTGVNIPLRSRMLTIADAYDAMVNDRPYRKAMTADEAIQELRDCAGTQFDPWLVEQFVVMLAARGGHERVEALPPEVGLAQRLASHAERVAAVLETNDMQQLRILTERLAVTAEHSGMDRIGRHVEALHAQLQHGLNDEGVRQLQRLLDECVELQEELLRASPRPASTDRPRIGQPEGPSR